MKLRIVSYLLMFISIVNVYAQNTEIQFSAHVSNGYLEIDIPQTLCLSKHSPPEVTIINGPGVVKLGLLPKTNGTDDFGEPAWAEHVRIPIYSAGIRDTTTLSIKIVASYVDARKSKNKKTRFHTMNIIASYTDFSKFKGGRRLDYVYFSPNLDNFTGQYSVVALALLMGYDLNDINPAILPEELLNPGISDIDRKSISMEESRIGGIAGVTRLVRESMECYGKAAILDPMNDKAWYGLGIGLNAIGDKKGSELCLRQLKKLNSQYLASLQSLIRRKQK